MVSGTVAACEKSHFGSPSFLRPIRRAEGGADVVAEGKVAGYKEGPKARPKDDKDGDADVEEGVLVCTQTS